MEQQDLYQSAAELISEADALLIGAGAGMGVDSGLPDFRGNEGFWKAYPFLAKARIAFTEVANPHVLERDPALGWGFYGHRLALYRRTVPHEGFQILRQWAGKMPLGARIFTSNVDGQFQKAGFSESQIHECHGSLHYLQCMHGCGAGVWSADSFIPEVDEANCRLLNTMPVCPHCGELARPNVLMFEDLLWRPERSEAQQREEQAWINHLARAKAKVVVVELGAGSAIPTVRHFSSYISRECYVRVIRINLRESEVSHHHDVGIPEGALRALRGIDAALNGPSHDHAL